MIFTSPGPILLQFGPLTLRWYGLLVTSGIVLGTMLAQRLAPARGIKPDLVGDFAVWVVAFGIPMARLYYVAFRWDLFQNNPWAIFAIWEGGIAIHGGILGGLLAGYFFTKRHDLSYWSLADVVAPGLALGQALGRWGNFFNSEAFGDPTSLPWKLFIPVANRPPQFTQFEFFHPTFLYESLWDLGLMGLLLLAFSRWTNAKPGTIAALYALGYGLGRFWIEGLRTDSLMLGPLKIAQMVSLAGVLLGCGALLWLNRRQAQD